MMKLLHSVFLLYLLIFLIPSIHHDILSLMNSKSIFMNKIEPRVKHHLSQNINYIKLLIKFIQSLNHFHLYQSHSTLYSNTLSPFLIFISLILIIFPT